MRSNSNDTMNTAVKGDLHISGWAFCLMTTGILKILRNGKSKRKKKK